jgi:hypothetical protein
MGATGPSQEYLFLKENSTELLELITKSLRMQGVIQDLKMAYR